MAPLAVNAPILNLMSFQIAGRTIHVEALDGVAGNAIKELFAECYLNEIKSVNSDTPHIRARKGEEPPQIPSGYEEFEVAGEGVCHTNGLDSYIRIQESLIAIGVAGWAGVEIWIDAKASRDEVIRLLSYGLSSALRRLGLFELHSAGLVDPVSGKGVLVIGPSGSGKSTLTVQLSEAGWPYLSDDVLMLSSERLGIEAWSVRRCFAVTPATIESSSLLSSNVVRNSSSAQEHKHRFLPHETFVSPFRESCAPRALFFTELSRQKESRVAKLTASATMERLIRMNPWSCFDRKTAAEHLTLLSQLVRQAEGFWLLAGEDLLDQVHASRFIGDYVRN